jgi:hypothetical protein
MSKLICIVLSLITVGFSASGQSKHEKYISTDAAFDKYSAIFEESDFFCFVETREFPIQWFDSLRISWLNADYSKKESFLNARPGEYFVFQIGVWARKYMDDLQVVFSDFKSTTNKTILAGQFTCFTTGGINSSGNPFTKKVELSANRVQSLWMGVDLTDVKEESYDGKVTISAGSQTQTVKIQVDVKGIPVLNHGFNEGKYMSRLQWLNSTVGFNDDITKGFIPVKVEGNEILIFGRSFEIAESGLPGKINSYFTSSNQSLNLKPEPLVNKSFCFVIEKENGEMIVLKPGKLEFTGQKPAYVSWKVNNTSEECDLLCSGQLEYDGFVSYKLRLKAKQEIKVKDIRLEFALNKEKAEYMMGLNHEGGLRPREWKWQWDTTRNQDILWIGAVNAGLRIKWKAENYRRQLVNVYYSFGPLNMPPSWGNKGKGGVTVTENNHAVVVNSFSGDRIVKTGEILNFDFELLITPFKTINNEIKYGDRYYHDYETVVTSQFEKAQAAKANIINVHHAGDIYPFINYPYLDANIDDIKQLVATVHDQNKRLKLYYTTRELTKNLPEFWAFNSLNGEIIYPGPGNNCKTVINPDGPNEWLIKNLREKYIPAWYNPIKEGKFKGGTDLSVITTPDSRLNNFYIGGLDWMVQNLKIDGVYVDDCALDRITIRRARKIIDAYRPAGRMDLHSWNHFNDMAKFASCLNLYMDLLPYFDLVWIGEGRDYDRMPDHWLIEVSGIPFGLPGQMLEKGGNPWRGMVYGITNRAGWGGDPKEIWKFWDEYNIHEKEYFGYWDEHSPVSCDNKMVRASFFKGIDESIIAVAGWGDKCQLCSLNIDWGKLGYNKSTCTFYIPYIKDFQDEQKLISLDKISIPEKKGFLIIIKPNK